MRLALRRGRVTSVEERGRGAIELTVEVAGEQRSAVGYRDLTGDVEPGDDVIVNVAAVELGLGGGGRDILHVNLTRGLGSEVPEKARALKLNYTSLQYPVEPIEQRADTEARLERPQAAAGQPVAALALHGQLEPCAWAAADRRPAARIGYVQAGGGALPGAHSHAVRELLDRGLLADHVTAGSTFGGTYEAVTCAGALAEGFGRLGWEAAIVGPGPGIVGSASKLGHGGLAALDSAHTSLALGARPILVPRLSSGDPRRRHHGLSHHSETVLELLLRPVRVALPAEAPYDVVRHPALAGHEVRRTDVDLDGYAASGLTTETMGRDLRADELFFAAGLAGGAVLAEEMAHV